MIMAGCGDGDKDAAQGHVMKIDIRFKKIEGEIDFDKTRTIGDFLIWHLLCFTIAL